MNALRCSLTALLLLCLSLGSAGHCLATQRADDDSAKVRLELFNTREIRGTLKAFDHWLRLIARARLQINSFNNCDKETTPPCSAIAQSWQQMERGGRGQSALEQLRWVNHFFNRWPYRLDLDVYKQSDYWATPGEFMRLSGDCEDYAITKYFALRALGFPSSSLRLVIVKDHIRNIAHAVLSVTIDNENLILDSISDIILTDKHYTHYRPQYSLNEDYRWAHIGKFTPQKRPGSKAISRTPQIPRTQQ